MLGAGAALVGARRGMAVLSEARLVKDAFEIAELEKACASTARGFEDVVKVLDKAEATSERYIEGTFFLRARVEGNDIGYGSICAAGPHATTLHWVRNDGDVRPGDLLLLDAGVETTELYTADITRTLPINGRYTEIQRKIYDAVYEAQEAGIAAVKPGAAYRDFHDAAQRVLTEKLVEWGLVEGPVERVLELTVIRRGSSAPPTASSQPDADRSPLDGSGPRPSARPRGTPVPGAPDSHVL
ncbi:Xaa-Pro dipeptidase [Streptomyces tanashiensis]